MRRIESQFSATSAPSCPLCGGTRCEYRVDGGALTAQCACGAQLSFGPEHWGGALPAEPTAEDCVRAHRAFDDRTRGGNWQVICELPKEASCG